MSSLLTLLQERISQTGPMPFAEWMQTVLYHQPYGYYERPRSPLGRHNDFITAPEVSPLFGQALAQAIAPLLAETNGDIIEWGAGSGALACALLPALQTLNQLPTRYGIREISDSRRNEQRARFATEIPTLCDRIEWLTGTEAPSSGVRIANEVMDALPVSLFRITETGIQEGFVNDHHDQFTLEFKPPLTAGLLEHVQALGPLPLFYQSEVALSLPAWLAEVNDTLLSGAIWLIDYGFPRHEYYHPDRMQGTLMCHMAQHAHPDPLWMPGEQDITAHVDFTFVAEIADQLGLQVAGYTTQAHFLLDCGIERLLPAPECMVPYYEATQALKMLVLPHEMGELFKVMGLSRNISGKLMGFSQDKRARL
ncbi:MAG: hypothetical protein A3J38_09185 [Gammaproteobacteria bacterium RIFCSPHIGHO2_12_FULL_45_9]|nr:MAG: hypothetical protein A3J38_09185 [Gammaproteobacteria bacterium RIFCSPHIGHO2_12_FULL_45_9]